jgi:hypothetical protein
VANTKIVNAIGAVDGANTRFYAGEPYTPSYTRYILNGRMHTSDAGEYGFTESNPDFGEITVNTAPSPGDVVQLFFLDRKVPETPSVRRLVGVLRRCT